MKLVSCFENEMVLSLFVIPTAINIRHPERSRRALCYSIHVSLNAIHIEMRLSVWGVMYEANRQADSGKATLKAFLLALHVDAPDVKPHFNSVSFS